MLGNWTDPSLLADEVYDDTVLADYLIGAVEGFPPGYSADPAAAVAAADGRRLCRRADPTSSARPRRMRRASCARSVACAMLRVAGR